jgi:hypothetical protein
MFDEIFEKTKSIREELGKGGFDAIATAFKRTKPEKPEKDEYSEGQQWKADIYAVGNELKKLNPSFDRDKFAKACGI